MNNTLEGIHSRIPEADALKNDLEDKRVEITATEQGGKKEWKEMKKRKRNEKKLRKPKRQTFETTLNALAFAL